MTGLGENFISRLGEHFHGLSKMLSFRQDVVGLIGGEGKYPNVVFRQKRGDAGQNADEGKIQYPLYAKRPPAVLLAQGVLGHLVCEAYQRDLLIRLAHKAKLALKIHYVILLYSFLPWMS